MPMLMKRSTYKIDKSKNGMEEWGGLEEKIVMVKVDVRPVVE